MGLVGKVVLILAGALLASGLELTHKSYFKNPIEVAGTNGEVVAIGREGRVEVRSFYRLKNLRSEVELPPIHGFAKNVLVPMPFYDIDVIPGGKIVVLGKGDFQYRRLFLIENRKKRFLLKSNLPLIQARFVTPNRVLTIGINGELVLLDSISRRVLWEKRVKVAPPVRFALNFDRTRVAVAGSNGWIEVYSTLTGKRLYRFQGVNRREPLALDYYSTRIIEGSFDGRVVVYQLPTGKPVYIRRLAKVIDYYKKPSLPTAVAILNDRLIAYTYRNRDIYIYDLKTRQGQLLKGDRYPIVGLQFLPGYLFGYTSHSITIWR